MSMFIRSGSFHPVIHECDLSVFKVLSDGDDLCLITRFLTGSVPARYVRSLMKAADKG